MSKAASRDSDARRDAIHREQCEKLAFMLREVLGGNAFYQRKLSGVDPVKAILKDLPLTTRAELQADLIEHPPYGTNLTYPLDRYRRIHQTSGSTGVPLRWLDTEESWTRWKRCWNVIYEAAGVTAQDRVMFPFAFGPFIGFWGAFEAAVDLKYFVLPAGGMSTSARLSYLLDHQVTVICCTPTYALRMIEVAAQTGVNIADSAVHALIVAGEPGGNIAATRQKIESGFGARVFDHAGMTEMGPWGFQCRENPGGMHINESEFIAEVLDPKTLEHVAEGENGELVLTNLGRIGSPLIRYRTGDQVCLTRETCKCGCGFSWLDGGILGRTDDMLLIRGNNVFPSVIEGMIREFDSITEFRIEAVSSGVMMELVLSIELQDVKDAGATDVAQRLTRTVRDRLHFTPTVIVVEPGTLPRFEMKAKRLVRKST